MVIMLDYWRERRRLRREIASLVRQGEKQKATMEGRPSKLAGPLVQYELLEHERLMEKARQLGIDYKSQSSFYEGYELMEDGRLSGPGYPRLRKAIRDERRTIVEQWVKIIVPILTALIGLVGALIGVVSILKK